MATPLSNDRMLKALQDEGVAPKQTSNWRTHNRNSGRHWGPVNGIVIHHTAGKNSLNLCINGTSSLPGPLCHAHLAKDGTLTLISNGRANHAGTFAQNAHNAVVNESSNHPAPSSSEPVDGNRHYYGIEIENLGNGVDFYPTAQYNKAVLWAAAICRAHGWSANSIIGHKEGTRRKIDPKGPVGSSNGADFTMNKFRADVQARLNNSSKPELPETGKDSPMHLYLERKNGVTLTPGEWYTVTWDRVWEPGKGWSDRSLAQTILKGDYLFQLSFGLRAHGLEKGQELQMRVARNSRKSNGEWQRAKSWPINSPVHSGGAGHFTHSWPGHLPGTDDNRLVVDVLNVGSTPVEVDEFVASVLYWKR